MYREFSSCEDNLYLEQWCENPPEEIKVFDENANLEEICKRFKTFLQKQLELIESLKKKNVIV